MEIQWWSALGSPTADHSTIFRCFEAKFSQCLVSGVELKGATYILLKVKPYDGLAS